jgi:predicted hydrolase (HD superfamily)
LAERGVSMKSAAPSSRMPILPACRASHRWRKTLFACDELAGFITAVSYVKPHRSVFEVDTPSVRKKMKDKAFARSVNREDIVNGARELGVELDEHIAFCVKAMQERADALGLKGSI